MKNFHLPLPEQTYNHLREQAERAGAPATTLARQAIDCWLRQLSRQARHDAIAAYAADAAGTRFDLDPELESAGIEYLVTAGKAAK
jgi:predicted transcriptional regulator